MTIDEFNRRLGDFGQQYIVSESNSFWEQAMERVVGDLRAMNLTSNPTSNINFQTTGDNVSLVMRAHLLFQNYGVKGLKNSSTQYGVPNEVGLNPTGSGRRLEFGVNPTGKHYWGIHYPGIGAKYDFDINAGSYNITEEFLRYFDAIQTQQSNL